MIYINTIRSQTILDIDLDIDCQLYIRFVLFYPPYTIIFPCAKPMPFLFYLPCVPPPLVGSARLLPSTALFLLLHFFLLLHRTRQTRSMCTEHSRQIYPRTPTKKKIRLPRGICPDRYIRDHKLGIRLSLG